MLPDLGFSRRRIFKYGLLDCDTVYWCGRIPLFQRTIMPPPSRQMNFTPTTSLHDVTTQKTTTCIQTHLIFTHPSPRWCGTSGPGSPASPSSGHFCSCCSSTSTTTAGGSNRTNQINPRIVIWVRINDGAVLLQFSCGVLSWWMIQHITSLETMEVQLQAVLFSGSNTSNMKTHHCTLSSAGSIQFTSQAISIIPLYPSTFVLVLQVAASCAVPLPKFCAHFLLPHPSYICPSTMHPGGARRWHQSGECSSWDNETYYAVH